MPDQIYCAPLRLICEPIDWWSSAGAWAQAFLSAGAIYAAARIARWQRESELRDKAAADKLVARSFGTLVLREARELEERLNKGIISSNQPFNSTEGREVYAVDVPQRLWDMARDMHLLGKPGGEILTAIFRIHEARQHLQPLGTGKILLWGDEQDAYQQQLQDASSACTLAIAGLLLLLGDQ